MNKRVALLFFLITIGCNSTETESQSYLLIKRGGHEIDTVSKKLLSSEMVDSIYELKYSIKGENGEFTKIENYKFPITEDSKNKRVDNLTLLDTKKISYKNKEYRVYKFLRDGVPDAETLFFFEPTFGILITKSAWWGNYDRALGLGSEKNNPTVYYLCEMIISDEDFFHKF